MKKKRKSQKNISLFHSRSFMITIALFVCVGVISGIFTMYIRKITNQQCYIELTLSTKEARIKLESNFRNDRVSLRMLSKVLAEKDTLNSLEVNNYLTIYDVNSLISSVGILTPSNTVILLRGSETDAGNAMDYKEEVYLGEHISGLQPSLSSSDSKVIRSFMPIRHDGQTKGLLFAEMSPSNIARAWKPEIYDGKVSFCIVDRKSGDFIVNSWDESIKSVSDIDSDELSRSIRSGETGFALMDSGSFISYMPMELENWEILVTVSREDVFASARVIFNSLLVFIAVEISLFFIYLLWMMQYTRKSIADTEKQANIDILTGLQNRNRYEDFCESIRKDTAGFSCIYIDANGLHEINNTRGHLAGDQMLRFIADTLKVFFGADTVYRIGGDEFVVFRKGRSYEEIKSGLANANEEIERNNYHVSSGICTSDECHSVDDMIKTAESRMYNAKRRYYESMGLEVRNKKEENQ